MIKRHILVHISSLRPGHIILHRGLFETAPQEITLCAKDLKRGPDGTRTVLGDSYQLGYRPVTRVQIYRALTQLTGVWQ